MGTQPVAPNCALTQYGGACCARPRGIRARLHAPPPPHPTPLPSSSWPSHAWVSSLADLCPPACHMPCPHKFPYSMPDKC